MKKISNSMLMLSIIALAMVGFASAMTCEECDSTCEGECVQTCGGMTIAAGDESQPVVAGQNMDAGDMSVAIDGDNLVLKFVPAPYWSLSGATDSFKVWAGFNLVDVPTNNNGVPIAGQFPYQDGTGIIIIPLSSLGITYGTCPETPLYVFAHFDLTYNDGSSTSTETGWAGNNGNGEDVNRWYFYSDISFDCSCTCECVPDVTETCETAWANWGENGLPRNEDYSGNNWGWYAVLPAGTSFPVSSPVYAAAGQNDLGKGYLLGTVTIGVVDNVVSVDDSSLPGDCGTEEWHIWLSNNPLPTSGGFSDWYKDGDAISGIDANLPVYIALHGVVCCDACEDGCTYKPEVPEVPKEPKPQKS